MGHSYIKHSDDFVEYPVSLTPEQIETTLLELGANFVRQMGNNLQADRCFLHENDSPTLGVSLDAPHPWNCFNPGCRKGTDLVGLVACARGIKREQAYAWLCTKFGGAIVQTVLLSTETVDATPQRFTLTKSTLAAFDNPEILARAVCHPRPPHNEGLCTPEQAKEFRIGYDRLDHRLIFPCWHEDGELAGYIGRSMRPKCPDHLRWMNYPEGKFKKHMCIMGAELPYDKGEPVIMVEGPTDYIKMRSLGFKNVRATMGAEFSGWQVEYFVRLGRPLVPMFDFDKAGHHARSKFTKAIANRVRLLPFKYPQECFTRDKDDQPKADPGSMTSSAVQDLRDSFNAGLL